MRSYTVVYDSILSFHMLPVDEINRAKSVLIQIFSTHQSWLTAEKIAQEAKLFFPKAVVCGVNTYANITPDKALEKGTILSILTFETAQIASTFMEEFQEEESFRAGAAMAKKCCRKDTKAVLLFCDPFETDPARLADGVVSVCGDIPVTGLFATDRHAVSGIYLLHDDRSFEKGALLVALSGERLDVSQRCFRRVKKTGPKLRVDDAEGCRLIGLEGTNAAETLRRYLGEDYLRNLPLSSYEIALAATEGDGEIASILEISDAGAIRLTTAPEIGSTWRFAYPDDGTSYAFCFPTHAGGAKTEAYLIYADLSRSLNPDGSLHEEVALLGDRAPVAGALGYAVFCRENGRNPRPNTHATTILAFTERSETADRDLPACVTITVPKREEASTLSKALASMAEKVMEDSALERMALHLLMEESEEARLLYDVSLRLHSANHKAQRILALDTKLAGGTDLTGLDPWIVETLRQGLEKKIYTRLGKVLDPFSGAYMQLEVTVKTLLAEDEAIGALATFRKV